MNQILFFVFISSLPMINSSYNPIPMGSVIVSTTHTISFMQPREYGGVDKLTVIFTAHRNMTIINTIFDLTKRDLYVLFTSTTNALSYICKLRSVEQLDSVIYQLPITFNISNINKLTSFTSDINNKRAFLTDETGKVTIFSMSGSMKTILQTPSTIKYPIRSVSFHSVLNRLFIITDSTLNSCTGLDTNNLQCCQALPRTERLRSIIFDSSANDVSAYVMDEQTGIYQVILNNITSCPVALRPINAIGTYNSMHLAIHEDLYFSSGSTDNSNHFSILIIGNAVETPRTISLDAPIVALHISYSTTKSTMKNEDSCFHGITYHDYRVAVVLAAIFGTIMGIFMCFNALFCIDFFMTKRIIGDLKKQIPHNLLEDRWNKLVNEKYAKLALEIHRKKDDPLPTRKSSAGIRKLLTKESAQTTSGADTYQLSNPIPKISTYLRRKSESYLARSRRSDEIRHQLKSNGDRSESNSNPTDTTNIPKTHIEEINEIDPHGNALLEKVRRDDSTGNKGEIL